jgi:TolB protein
MVFRLIVISVLLGGCAHEEKEKSIVFQSSRDGNFELYTMDLEGKNLRRVTDSPANDVTPSWSPDGERVLFATDRDQNWEIYTIVGDGTDPKRLTSPPGANTSPSWVLNGSRILFVSTRDAVNGELYLMDPDGGNVVRLTFDSMVKDNPVMTADGTRILYTVNEKGRFGIAAFHVLEKTTTILTDLKFDSMMPSISHGDQQVVFSSNRGGRFQLYQMSPSGEHQVQIIESDDDLMTPCWLSGSSGLLFSKRGGIYLFSLTNRKERMLSTKGDSYPHVNSY